MAVFLEKSTCPQCKRPAQTLEIGLSFCAVCQVTTLEKTSEYDFSTFNGPLFKLSDLVDVLITDGHKTVLSDYATASLFIGDNAEEFPNGFSVYFLCSPTDHVFFSADDVKTGWAESFFDYFAGLSEDCAHAALEYYTCCRQNDISEWQGTLICDYRGNVDDAINAYADYLRDSGLYADCGVPDYYIDWYKIAKDCWYNGGIFFTSHYVFSSH